MIKGAWDENSGDAFVRPVSIKSPAQDFFQPSLKRVGVKISSDEPDFVPMCEEGSDHAFVFANIPANLILSENASFIMDFGFSIELPPGYRCRAESLLPSIFVSSVDSSRFKLTLFNAGTKVVLKHKQKIAKIWIEPIHMFTILES